jgi:phosphonopyruvate decarboxylase
MIRADVFLDALTGRGFGPVVGVPCSFLTGLINTALGREGYIAANNEGEAVAIAAGAALAGRKPVVMFQNSGLGNAVSPLTSLNYPFRIPLLLIVTHRGQPGIHDEPQHELMGQITEQLLRLQQIECAPFPASPEEIPVRLAQAEASMGATQLPFALVLPKGGLAEAPAPPAASRDTARSGQLLPGAKPAAPPMLSRAHAIAAIADASPAAAALIATTGKIGRELFTLRERAGNLYLVGSMGCAASVGLGVAMHSQKPVVVLDGDGAALMRLEALVSVGHYRPGNLVHVVLDNGMHESTGGQPSLSATVWLAETALSCGYATATSLVESSELTAHLRRALSTPGPHMIHVRVLPGALEPLGRPTLAPPQVKERFMAFLRG